MRSKGGQACRCRGDIKGKPVSTPEHGILQLCQPSPFAQTQVGCEWEVKVSDTVRLVRFHPRCWSGEKQSDQAEGVLCQAELVSWPEDMKSHSPVPSREGTP